MSWNSSRTWRDDGVNFCVYSENAERIEAGEIEAVLRGAADVSDALVVLQSGAREAGSSAARLVAYVVGKNEGEASLRGDA